MSAELSITIYILTVTIGVFILGIKGEFGQNQFYNLIAKRSLIAIGLFLMMFNTSILTTIASNAGVPVTHELLNVYFWIFGWGGVLAFGFVILGTLFQAINMLREMRIDQRMGKR